MNLHQHFKRAAKHHTQVAEVHGSISKLHSDHAEHHVTGNATHTFHKALADQHVKLQQLHQDHSDHCGDMADSMKAAAGSSMDDVHVSEMGDREHLPTAGEDQFATERVAAACDDYFSKIIGPE